mmetsp:Transcript_38171/g.61108  ORF Transcript_38171/g.61108 Transcript_38171/m.61108 type:complete len:88 (+) Transcript_38171:108-371(+)
MHDPSPQLMVHEEAASVQMTLAQSPLLLQLNVQSPAVHDFVVWDVMRVMKMATVMIVIRRIDADDGCTDGDVIKRRWSGVLDRAKND